MARAIHPTPNPNNVARGERHRDAIRRLVVPPLKVGMLVPCAHWIGRLLGIDATQALRHRNRVFREEGIVVARDKSRLRVVRIHPQVPQVAHASTSHHGRRPSAYTISDTTESIYV